MKSNNSVIAPKDWLIRNPNTARLDLDGAAYQRRLRNTRFTYTELMEISDKLVVHIN